MSMKNAVQFFDILIIALLAGSVFGVWRGYDPTGFSATGFLEVHQGAVRGLNTLLPAMGAAAIILTVMLSWNARDRPIVCSVYLLALAAMVTAALVTRFGNQPINATVMGWTAGTMPTGWEDLRDAWWRWHMVRVGATMAALAMIVAAVMSDISTRPMDS